MDDANAARRGAVRRGVRRMWGDLDRAAEVAVTGPLDARAARELARRLGDAPEAGRVTIDLGGVTEVSPAALDLLLAAQQRVEDSGGRFELRNPSAELVLLLHDALHAGNRRDPGDPAP